MSVSSTNLFSGRDRDLMDLHEPRDKSKWLAVTVRSNSISSLMNPVMEPPTTSAVNLWLPKDQETVARIVDVYFERLNYHRPVFTRLEFDQKLAALYHPQSNAVQHDPGFICSFYLVLALGTMSELSRLSGGKGKDGRTLPPEKDASHQKLMPQDWPDYEDLFTRALAAKSDMRVSISSLQALILLHLYLYAEVSLVSQTQP